ncbi:DoxX family protein [Brevibacillus brevis]
MLGAIALVIPGFPRLKEWVHAGIFFLMTGAALSHAHTLR